MEGFSMARSSLTYAFLLAGLLLFAATSEAAPRTLGTQTLAEFLALPNDYQTFYLAGALELSSALEVTTCASPYNVKQVQDLLQVSARIGKLQLTENFSVAVYAVMVTEFGCRTGKTAPAGSRVPA
jgi:hypothetical protein